MEVYDFIEKLHHDKVFTSKQLGHVENIFIYVKDLNVYKVIISVYPAELKKAKKVGLSQQYTIFERDFGRIKEPCPGTKHGYYQLSYKPFKRTVCCYTGEQLDANDVRKNMINYRRHK